MQFKLELNLSDSIAVIQDLAVMEKVSGFFC